MNTRADKMIENKHQSVMNNVSDNKRDVDSDFQVVDNRSEMNTQFKLYNAAFNNSIQAKQLRAYDDMVNRKAPIQGKFIGDLAIPLLEINPALMGLDGSYFMKFYKELSDHETSIAVVEGKTSYDASNKTLYLNGDQIKFLKKYTREFASEKSKQGDGAVASSHIAMISHELSHARDHIVKGKEINSSTKAVVDTELRAWAVEAISAIEVATQVKEMDKDKDILVKSWVSIKPAMLDNLAANAESNEIINRLQRYIIRSIKMKDALLIQEWVNENKDFLSEEIVKLSAAVTKRVK
jgi:hypothetical protein